MNHKVGHNLMHVCCLFLALGMLISTSLQIGAYNKAKAGNITREELEQHLLSSQAVPLAMSVLALLVMGVGLVLNLA